MSWARGHIEQLRQGHTVAFRPRGQSMAGRIASGQRCTVEPLQGRAPQANEIVLCTVHGAHYLHLVKAVQQDRYLIGNNRGGINGWVGLTQIHGRCVRIED